MGCNPPHPFCEVDVDLDALSPSCEDDADAVIFLHPTLLRKDERHELVRDLPCAEPPHEGGLAFGDRPAGDGPCRHAGEPVDAFDHAHSAHEALSEHVLTPSALDVDIEGYAVVGIDDVPTLYLLDGNRLVGAVLTDHDLGPDEPRVACLDDSSLESRGVTW
jgi:hypothetical protein